MLKDPSPALDAKPFFFFNMAFGCTTHSQVHTFSVLLYEMHWKDVCVRLHMVYIKKRIVSRKEMLPSCSRMCYALERGMCSG